jgi:hypothetical protein
MFLRGVFFFVVFLKMGMPNQLYSSMVQYRYSASHALLTANPSGIVVYQGARKGRCPVDPARSQATLLKKSEIFFNGK